MKGLEKGLFLGAALCAAGAFTAMPALAGTKVQGNIVPQNIGGTCSGPCFTIGKPGKFKVSESKKAGSGGIEMQLNIKGVDCANADPPAENDGGQAGKCDDVNHVLEVNTDFAGLETKVGLLYDLVKGKTVFQATGKNKLTGADAFGALVGAIQGQSLGIGVLRVHAPGSNPASCLNAPLLVTTCTDGEKYGIGGIVASNEPGTAPPPCATAADCSVTQVCSAGACVTESCTQDSDCANFTGPGSNVACNETLMQCCLPNLDTDPNCDID
jgi:hypothetical protein